MTDGNMHADPAAELAGAQKRLRRRMLWIIGAGLAAAGLAIGAIVVCNRPGPELPPIERPYLWRVEGPGGPSYLFGTLHIGYSTGDLPRSVLSAQEDAATTVLETDLLIEKPPRRRPAEVGRPRLEPEVWRQLGELTGVAEGELVTWDSSRLVGAVIWALAPRAEPMDRGLQARAAKLGKHLVFLEERSLEELMSERQILDGLTTAVRRRAEFRAQLIQMAARYATGGDDGCTPAAGGLGGLVDDLNRTWKLAIEAQVRRGRVFVAIGCSHLVGSGSVVAYLQEQGLDVKRIDR